MPPAAKRNASVILFDVNTNAEFAEAAEKCLLNVCASKWFLESKDCTKLILLNSEQTNNSIESKFGKCPHICEATAVINYDPKLLKPHIENVEKAQGDWLMGLAVAIEEIKENYLGGKGIMNLQLLLVTDLSTRITAKEKRIAFVIENLNKMNVHLYILGPEVKIPNFMSSFEDIREWSKNIEFVVDEEENPNLPIAKQIVQNTNGIICGLELGQELFKCYTKRWGMQPWKVPLTIGNSFTILCATTRFLNKQAGPKFRGETLSGYKEPWKWHLEEDLLIDVPYNNVIGGVAKHGKFVPLPEDVEKNFKCSGPRRFKIIGFTDIQNVPEFYMQGSGNYYVESDGSKCFQLLVQVLAKQNKCAIAVRAYSTNCKPKLVALLPETEKGIFLLVDLPYADSIKGNFIEQDLSEAPELDRSNPTVDAMYDYLQKLDVTDSGNKENGSVKVPLAANLQDSIRLNLLTQRCLQKYLGNEINFEEITLKTPQFVDDSNFKQFVPARPVVEPKKRSKD